MMNAFDKRIRLGVCVLAVFALLSQFAVVFAAVEISKVRSWAAPDHTRIVFDLSDVPDYSYVVSENLLSLEFYDASLHASISGEMIIGKPGIDKILFESKDGGKCKVSLTLGEHWKTDVFKLKKFMDKPDRVVVDVFAGGAKTEEPVSQPAGPSAATTRIIVVDPGHGGEDPGAVGRGGTYEKHVVLSISREIKKAIDKIPGYRAILTRDGDYYVSFSKRLQIARDADASLFISVHADAARNRRARGSSVYCLSRGGVSSEAARLLANNENLSDVIGGVANGESNNQSDEIILNMFQTNTLNYSKTFATALIDRIGSVQCLKYPVFQEAPFRVLKLLDIPAVLLETAYLSNAQEERMLKKESFHKLMARAVAEAVVNHFSGQPGGQPVVVADQATQGGAWAKLQVPFAPGEIKTTVYRVKRGETLITIARQHDTTVSVLLRLNDMRLPDRLYAGKRIVVPVAQKGQTVVSYRSYRVKKGDTLYSLAKSCAMTVDDLRRLNSMRAADVLLVGQKIKLPQ